MNSLSDNPCSCKALPGKGGRSRVLPFPETCTKNKQKASPGIAHCLRQLFSEWAMLLHVRQRTGYPQNREQNQGFRRSCWSSVSAIKAGIGFSDRHSALPGQPISRCGSLNRHDLARRSLAFGCAKESVSSEASQRSSILSMPKHCAGDQHASGITRSGPKANSAIGLASRKTKVLSCPPRFRLSCHSPMVTIEQRQHPSEGRPEPTPWSLSIPGKVRK